MFYVINKEKITAYVISISTVIVLLIMAGVLMQKNNTIETSAGVKNENQINQLKIDENVTDSNDKQANE